MLYLLKAKIAQYETEAVRWFMPKIQINVKVCTECLVHLNCMYFKFIAFLLREKINWQWTLLVFFIMLLQ